MANIPEVYIQLDDGTIKRAWELDGNVFEYDYPANLLDDTGALKCRRTIYGIEDEKPHNT